MPPPPPPGPPGMAGCDSGYDMHQSRYLNGTVYDTIALPNATGDPDHLLSKCCAKCTADGKKCDGWQFGEICDDPNPPSGTEITLFPCAVSSDSRSFAKTGSGQTQGKLWNEISRRRFSQVRLSAARSSISCVLVSTASSRPSALTAVSASRKPLPSTCKHHSCEFAKTSFAGSRTGIGNSLPASSCVTGREKSLQVPFGWRRRRWWR